MNSAILSRAANLVEDGMRHNEIFDLNSVRNRDGCFEPYKLLKQIFCNNGFDLNTPDINGGGKIWFELHMDVQSSADNNIPKYVVLRESPQIKPINGGESLLKKYRIIFTWQDNLVDGKRYIKINLPNKIVVNNSRGWEGKKKFCCLISGNKTVSKKTSLELYSERVKTIRWFEQNAPQKFDLYGVGWDGPAFCPGLTSRVVRKISSYLPINRSTIYFPSYRGKVISKFDTMKEYRFNICYENIRELPGYITEKIWDSFFAGCIPVYWGASNVTAYIPKNCFIDRRDFSSHEALYKAMSAMTEEEYIEYQERIASFLNSSCAKLFSSEYFTETIVKNIVNDLGISN